MNPAEFGQSAVRPTPLFLSGVAGQLFAVYYAPLDRKPVDAVIHVPALAEEMNRSRRVVTQQAYAFARQGVACLIIDLLGTGDSAGDFAEARWELWQQDIETAWSWLEQQEIKRISLWGLRLGALLALDYVAQSRRHCHALLAWQLQPKGSAVLKQFLRLRTAANLLQNSTKGETVQSLRRQLLAGEVVEAAGYALSPAMAKAWLNLDAGQLDLPTQTALVLLEVQAEASGSPDYSAYQNLIARWQRNGHTVTHWSGYGDAFWLNQTPVAVPLALIEQTTQAVLVQAVNN